MSLIDEALRRAQEESARRGEGKGTQRWVAGPPPRRRTGPALVAVIVAGGLVAGLALGAWLFRSRGGSPVGAGRQGAGMVAQRVPEGGEAVSTPRTAVPETPVSKADALPPPPVAAPSGAAQGAGRPEEAAGAAPDTGASPSPAPPEPPDRPDSVGPAQPAAPAATPVSVPEPTPPGGSGLPAAARQAEAAAPAPATEVEEQTFRRIARLPDGTTLSLNGIAFSEERPMALVNGQVLAAGETVAGYRVMEILPDRVRLEREGATVILRLK